MKASQGIFFSLAYTTTGTEEAMPWLPLPELIITGISHPPIRASEAATHTNIVSITEDGQVVLEKAKELADKGYATDRSRLWPRRRSWRRRR